MGDGVTENLRTGALLALVEALVDVGDASVRTTTLVDGDVVSVRMQRGQRTATVSTPGDWWFPVGVDGGFSTFELDREPSEDEIRVAMARYIAVARAYLESGGVEVRRGLFRRRELLVRVGDNEVPLMLPILRLPARRGRREPNGPGA